MTFEQRLLSPKM